MSFQLSAKYLIQWIAALAFVLAGAQFSHAHEFNLEPSRAHVHSVDTHDQDIDAVHAEAGGLHCGAHLLPLVSECPISEVAQLPIYAQLPLPITLADSLGFDTPPPRA